MDVPKVGSITTDSSILGRRDAFHVTAVLVKSTQAIEPGASIRFAYREDSTVVILCAKSERHAVADPFVKELIQPYQLFWAFLEPSIVSNLVHSFDIEGFPLQKAETDDTDEFDHDDGCAGCYN